MNKIKKGNLNYDQSGRAYPDNPELSENWDCIWKYGDKYYELVGDNQHKEWEEINIYDQIIDEAYNKFVSTIEKNREEDYTRPVISKEEFIYESKLNKDFSDVWGLKIEERELSLEERYGLMKNGNLNEWLTIHYKEPKTMTYMDKYNIPTKLITLTYNNETIEVYEHVR